ncbi:MFS transporter [Aureobasidium subglaciale]|nr:MFS transporter [Aureobasidium subglaciale]KAI5217786.1 MFS transporter [Aureobasidium subglaciale]KAI5220708.1 MFS transporter [Aureobasidium subglaciale]KAI5258402.1 MFS transporter [Aureobasidium subglaciale]
MSHNVFPSPNYGDRRSSEVYDEKATVDMIDRVETADTPGLQRMEPPELVRNMSPEERARAEKALVRKIDFRLMPMLVLMYILNYCTYDQSPNLLGQFFNFLQSPLSRLWRPSLTIFSPLVDRNNIASARLAGLETDLALTSSQYETSVSILFVGYLLMQIPSNLFLNKIGKPALYLPTVMVVWGIISTCTAAVQSFGGLVAVRFVLGFVEAAYFPGCLFFLSSWYTRKELAFRSAVLYSGSLISGAFSGLIAAGILDGLSGHLGLSAWRWLFILEGSITIGIAAIAFFVLPNFPRTTKWLSEEQRQLATWRLQEDIGQDDWVSSEGQSFWHGFKLAFTDLKTYVLMVLLFGIVASGSVTNFFPTAPPYCLAVITAFANAIHADRTGERFFHIAVPLCVAVVAFIIAASTTSLAPRYLAMMLMVPGVYTGYVVALAWISNTIPRPPAKRAAALAGINAISNASSIYASYMYPKSAGPRYVVAMSVNCATAVMAIIAAFTLRTILMRLNKKLDRGEHVEGAVSAGKGVPGEAAKKGFRFLL